MSKFVNLRLIYPTSDNGRLSADVEYNFEQLRNYVNGFNNSNTLPSQTGQAGNFLATNGTTPYWTAGTPGPTGATGATGATGPTGPAGPAGSTYSQSFTNTDLVVGVLSVAHGLGQKYVAIQIYDNTDNLITPDGVVLVDANDLTINLSSYGGITGTWHIVVI